MKSLYHSSAFHLLFLGIAALVLFFLPVPLVMAGPPSAGPDEVRVAEGANGHAITLTDGKILVVSLESNPSTGYTWQMDEVRAAAASILRQVGPAEMEPAISTTTNQPQLGAPGRQIIRFETVAAGQETLTLVYRRPWEQGAGLKSFNVRVQATGPSQVLSLSLPVPTATPPLENQSVEPMSPSLPDAFNWCNQGGCPPIRDQGACGSCWAFSTAGPLEANILIRDGFVRDLAEQYLLSCNNYNYSCAGGWFAHDYYMDLAPAGETAAGAVYETNFPYLASKVPCNYLPTYPQPHPHYERITSWDYIGSNVLPSVAEIKEAISTYGPVAAAICSGPAFSKYRNGLFETDERSQCGGSVNHGIVLVGWDDNYQGSGVGAWRLRNSWGSAWGEGGYMNIKYGVSNVGYRASYVVYNSSGCPDSYELDNTSTQAREIIVNQPAQPRRFQAGGDVDWVRFTAVAGVVYTTTLTNLEIQNNPILELYDRDGITLLGRNNNCSNEDDGCLISWTAPANGTYFFKVSHLSNQGGCSGYGYSLAVTGNSGQRGNNNRIYIPLLIK